MIIVGFTTQTSMIMPRIFCRHFRHCAIIEASEPNMIMHQFIHRGKIEHININQQGIQKLSYFGWVFIYIPRDIQSDLDANQAYSCVDYAKRALGIHKRFVLTPDALFDFLMMQ